MMFGGQAIPRGVILSWYGVFDDIPKGWVWCDGNNGTPNLKNKFIQNTGIGSSVHDEGGATTHTHVVSGELLDDTLDGGADINETDTGEFGANLASDVVNVTIDTPESRPPYHCLYIIMKL